MLKKIIGLTALLGFCSSIFAQVSFTGTLFSNSPVYWKTYYKGKWLAIDSTKTDDKGKFSFPNASAKVPGIYVLASNEMNEEFVWANEEVKTLLVKNSFGADSISILSKENLLFAKVKAFEAQRFYRLGKLQEHFQNTDAYMPFYKAFGDSIDRVETAENIIVNNELAKISANNKTSFVTQYIIPFFIQPVWNKESSLYKRYDNAASLRHYHFFDNIGAMTATNNNITLGNLPEKKLLEYFIKYCSKTPKAFKDGIDLIFSKVTQANPVRNLLLSEAARIFEDKGPEEVFLHIIANYLNQCESTEGFGDWVNKAKTLELLSIGKPAPEIEMNKLGGEAIKLSSLKGKKVLVLFWASWCSHCRAELPNYKVLYDTYKDRGFEVYAVSLDEDAQQWITFVNENSLSWINVCDFKKWKSAGAVTYNIKSTPNNYLIDEQGHIVGKDLMLNQIEDIIQK